MALLGLKQLDSPLTGSLRVSGSAQITGSLYVSSSLSVGGTISGSEIYLEDYIYHTGDTDTYIGFPTGDKFQGKAGGINMQFEFDYYLIGPYDLSLSLGIPGKFDNELFMCYVNKVKDKIPTDKMAVHIPTKIEEQIKNYEDYGLKCLGMDTVALLEYHKGIMKDA